MLDVLKYIEKYAENHNIIDYSLKHRVLSLKDFNTQQSFAPGIGFFYNLKVCGEISDVNNITNPFLFVSTPTEFLNFADIATIKDYGTIQVAESNLIITAESMLTVKYQQGANCLFNKIHTAQFMYLYMTINERRKGNSNKAEKVNINIIDKVY